MPKWLAEKTQLAVTAKIYTTWDDWPLDLMFSETSNGRHTKGRWLSRFNLSYRGVGHTVNQLTERKEECFLSASTQIAGILGQWVLMMFLVLMNRNCVSVLFLGFPVSLLWFWSCVTGVFVSLVLVNTPTHYYTYLLEIVLLPSAAVFTFCQAEDDWMCICVCLDQAYNWFWCIIVTLVFSKKWLVLTFSKSLDNFSQMCV